MKRGLPWTVAALVGITSCAPGVPDATSPVEGAWRFVGLQTVASGGDTTDVATYESLVLFGESHYSIAFGRGGEKVAPFADIWLPTDSEMAARLASITVNAGRYDVDGSTLTTRPMFALVPSFIGGRAEYEYRLNGNTLTLVSIRIESSTGIPTPDIAAGTRVVYTLERVE